MPARSKKRPYDASGRRHKAEETQRRVLQVARKLFAARGYVETTIDLIAEQAGVAVPTVYAAFGSKRGLLTRLLDTAVSGEPTGASVLKTPGAQAVFAEPDPRRALTLFAHHMRHIQERVGTVYEVMKSAARVEPEIAEMFERAQRNRHANLEALARRLAERGPLRGGMSVEDAGRTIWALCSIEVRQLLTERAGWSGEKFEEWLAQTLIAALLPDAR